MYISFVGISGSGKTTLATRVYQELQNLGYRCYLHKGKFFEDHNGFLYKMIWGFYLLSYFDHHLFKTMFYKYCLRKIYIGNSLHYSDFFIPFKQSYFLCQLDNGVADFVLYDEDFIKWGSETLQTNIYELKDIKDAITESILPKSNHFLQVFVKTSVDLASWRYVDREGVNLNNFNSVLERRSQHALDIHKTVSAVDTLDRVSTVTIDGDEDLEKNVQKVLTFILRKKKVFGSL